MWKKIEKHQIKDVLVGAKVRINGVENVLESHYPHQNDFGFDLEDPCRVGYGDYITVFGDRRWDNPNNTVEIWEEDAKYIPKAGETCEICSSGHVWKKFDCVYVDSETVFGYLTTPCGVRVSSGWSKEAIKFRPKKSQEQLELEDLEQYLLDNLERPIASADGFVKGLAKSLQNIGFKKPEGLI